MTSATGAQSVLLTPQPLQWLKGCGFFLFSIMMFATLDALAKGLVHVYSAPLVNFSRYTVIIVLAFSALLIRGYSLRVAPPERNLLLLRGVLLGVSGTAFMPSLQYMPLAEATAIYFVSPLIVLIFAPRMLGEKVGLKQYLALAAGMIGMLFIVRPGSGEISLIGTALLLISAVSFALVQIYTRKLSHRVYSEQIFVYAASMCWCIGAVTTLIFWPTLWPTPTDWAWILLMSVVGGLGQYALIYAYKYVPASNLAPLNYLQLVLAVIYGELLFGQMPTLSSLAGIVLVVVAGLSLTLPMLITYLRSR